MIHVDKNKSLAKAINPAGQILKGTNGARKAVQHEAEAEIQNPKGAVWSIMNQIKRFFESGKEIEISTSQKTPPLKVMNPVEQMLHWMNGIPATNSSPAQKQSSEYARSLIEASLDPLVTISIEGKITDMNQATLNITGITREKLTGTDFFDYFTQPHMAREVYEEVFAKGSVADSPLTLRHKNGKLTDVLFNGSVYKDDKGNVLGVVIIARDVTAQKLVSKYSLSLIEASLDPLVTINPEGKITDMNEATVNITGITREKLIGSDFLDYFTEPQKARKVYQEVFANGSVADSPLTLRHKNGKLTDVLFNGSVYKDDRGNVLGVVIVARDVTAQKLLSKYSLSLIEASRDPLVTISPEGKITDMNEATVNITGITREKLIGSDFFDYFTEPQKAREVYQEVFARGSVADSPLTLRHKNGKLTDVLFNGSVYKDDRGNVLGVVIVARDVTAQRLLSKYSLSLIEASRDPLFTISPEGKITDVNNASVKVTGISREKLIGTDFYDYFTDHEKAQEGYKQVFEKGFVVDYPLTIRDHKLTDVLFNGSVYKDDRGNVLGAVVVARDITEQKRFENDLIESKSNAERSAQKAEESTKLKEAFLANMSHEIRTPMNAIIGFSDILSKRMLGEQEKEFVKTIKSAGENLLTIINDILDISKIEAGMMTFEENTFSVKETFQSLNTMLMGKAKEKNLGLVFSCEADVPDVVLGDHTRLTQIIINLTGNAIKFTSNGSVQVHAKVRELTDEITLLEFSIKDTGIGIPADKLEHIFERFRQADSQTTRKYGGTGLGLSIAKQLVELQGGTLSVVSELKKGSVFSFCIPYKKSTRAALAASEKIEKKYDMKDLCKLKILLAEDNQLNVKLILSLFSENNLKLQVAENGSVAIEKLKENKFDIILMDMEMPVMNGYEAATIIRKELNNNIPIIAMTAHAMAGERERCLSLGMNDYISKPINANLLFEKMYDLTCNS